MELFELFAFTAGHSLDRFSAAICTAYTHSRWLRSSSVASVCSWWVLHVTCHVTCGLFSHASRTLTERAQVKSNVTWVNFQNLRYIQILETDIRDNNTTIVLHQRVENESGGVSVIRSATQKVNLIAYRGQSISSLLQENKCLQSSVSSTSLRTMQS